MLTRRQLIKRGAIGGAGIIVPNALLNGTAFGAPATAQLASYRQALQVPPVANVSGGVYNLSIRQAGRRLHPSLPAATRVWEYQGAATNPNSSAYRGYLGPTIVARRGTPLQVNYTNALPYSTYAASGFIPVDRNLTPGHQDRIRTMAHFHGGFVHGQFDGNPAVDRGYTPGSTQSVWYPNAQRAALLWYHDHGQGTTRLNVFAGLAGAYVMRDSVDTGLASNPNHLPVGYGTGPGKYEVPLVIQDRLFVNSLTSGNFLYPTTPQVAGGAGSYGMCGNDPNQYGMAPGPWIGEYFGDEMLVNGLCTPFVNVEPRVYRFRVLNGCNGRMLNLTLTPGTRPAPPQITYIGSDGGLLGAPVRTSRVLLAPGERADILVDFRGYAGQKLLMRNSPLPKPYVSPAGNLPDVMQINVGTTVSDNTNNTVPTSLTGGEWASPGSPNAPLRTINLDEWNAGLLRWYLTLTGNGAPQGGFSGGACFEDAISETPPNGAVQEWDFVNRSADTHPMHVHLVQFQVVHRRAIGAAAPAPGTGVRPEERGWKDTVAAHPGMVTRIRAKFDLPTQTPPIGPPSGFAAAGTSPNYKLAAGEAQRTFVYHCHILEHEDNDMMRPFTVK